MASAQRPNTTRPEGMRTLARLAPYLWAYRGRAGIALVCLVAAKLATVALPVALKHIVDSLDPSKHAGSLVVPVALIVAYGALRLASTLFGQLRDLVFVRVTQRAVRRVALEVFQHLHGLDLRFHLERQTGGLSRDIERGSRGISFLLSFMLFNIVPTVLEIGLVTGILFYAFGWQFAAVIVVAVIIYIVFSVTITEWRTGFVRQANELDSRANTRAIDSLINYETVKYFTNEAYEAANYDAALANWESAAVKSQQSLAALNAGQALIIAAGITAMLALAAQGVAGGRMSLGDLVMVNAYMIQLFIPLNFLGFVYREVKRALADMERMFGLLERHGEVADAPSASTLAVNRGEVRFDDVSFAYGADRQVLEGVSFTVAPGSRVAVVGPSGAGKSTLARLLFRFYDADSGRITIDGQDIRDVTQASLREAIGVVPQDTVLFNDTLGYNIAYGRPDASQAEIETAARRAHLDRFIARLPQGYDTLVGERGLKLSGGEKQRVAIARALLKNPPVLIYDEATSSLDSEAERHILDAMRDAARQRTTLVIAHRLSTIIDADRIFVLDHGHIVEQGTHAELVRCGGLYARLWELQREHGGDAELPPTAD